MTSVKENRLFYEYYNWSRDGNEWAGEWRSSAMQWAGTLYPRISRYLPAATVVEIGAGFGRWAQFLLPFCRRLVLLDISPKCVEVCREKFSRFPNVESHLTDGVSIEGVQDGQAGFVFSFFSLVHADVATIGQYLGEIRRVLSPYGVAFLHHSNAGADAVGDPPPPGSLLDEFRDPTVSAEIVERMVGDLGLCCPVQEVFNWDEGRGLTDCFSVIAWPASNLSRECQKLVNSDFPSEKRYLGNLEEHYGGLILRPPSEENPALAASAGAHGEINNVIY